MADAKDPKRATIRNSLMKQLAMMGGNKDHFTDLVEDYMEMWDVKNDLFTDIKARGVVYIDVSSVGVSMQKNNPSVKELVTINKQMLSVLKELGLSTANARSGEEDVL